MPFRGPGFWIALLFVLMGFSGWTSTLEEAGYATVASFDLNPAGDLAPVAVTGDTAGNIYVLGQTRVCPVGAQRLGAGGGVDLTVSKVTAEGEILFTTVIGGSGDDYGDRILVDDSGHVFLFGWTASTDFPLAHALHPGASSRFLCSIAADGASFVYSTFMRSDWSWSSVAVTANGEAILTGSKSRSGSMTDYFFDGDVLVIKLGEYGSNVLFSTTIGGLENDAGDAITLDPSGDVWIAGRTDSPDFPVTADAAQKFLPIPQGASYCYNAGAFLLKLASDGSVAYATFWQPEGCESISAISAREDGSLFIGGSTSDPFQIAEAYIFGNDRPYQPALPVQTLRPSKAYIALLNPYTGQTLSKGVVPALGYSAISQIVSDGSGNAHVSGFTGPRDYMAQFDPAGSTFSRFAVFEECPYAGARGLVMTPGGELAVAAFRTDAAFSVTENSLLKLTPALVPSTNRAPLVTVAPSGAANVPGFYDPLPPTISPAAVDLDGAVDRVELFAGTTLLTTFTSPPYAFSWSNAPYGEHILHAVATDNAGLSATSCPVLFKVSAPPANDSFYRSKLVSGTSFTVAGTTAGATPDPFRTQPGMLPDYRVSAPSVWWCWRAPYDGAFSVTIISNGVYWSHNVAVFTGRDLDHLTSLGDGKSVAFRANAGTAYYIRVSGFDADYTLSLAPATPPPNDNFAGRSLISGAPIAVSGNNFNATFEPELNNTNAMYDDFGSVWWNWTALDDGLYLFTTRSTNLFGQNIVVSPVQSSSTFPQPIGYTSVVARAAAGQQFLIRVSGEPSDFELRVDRLMAPPNDYFANASLLAGLPVSTNGSFLGATAETNEPSHSQYSPPQSSIWYKWTAPETTPVILEVRSEQRNAVLSIYTGSGLGNLTLETNTYGNDIPARFLASAGTEYWISVDSYWSGTGAFSLTFRPPNYPSNDRFADRIMVTEAGFGSNAEATIEAVDEPQPGEIESIWYSWVAPSTGAFTLVTQTYGFYGRSGVYSLDAFSDLVAVAVSSERNSQFLRFAATAGTEYQITFISRAGDGGRLAFRVRPSDPPVNDDLQNAIELSGASVLVEASNIDAAAHDPFSNTSAVWWTWTAPGSGPFVVSIPRASFSAGVTVFRGTEPGLTPVTSTYSLPDSVLFDAVAGEQLRIAAYSIYSGQQGDFTLAIDRIARPANDDFEDATPLYGSTPSTVGSTLGATAEAGETAVSVWWSWTAPASGQTSVKLSLARSLEVFTGTSVQTLTRVAESSTVRGPSTAAFNAQAGVTYYIRVSGAAFSPFTLTLEAPEMLERPLLSAPLRSDGAIQFSFDGLIGTTNVLEASGDLQAWLPISTNLIDCFPYSVTVPVAGESRQFYRARLVR